MGLIKKNKINYYKKMIKTQNKLKDKKIIKKR